MAYYSGAAVDMTAVRAALIAACTAEDWLWDSGNEVLYKAGVYFHMPVVSGFLRLQGRTALTTGAAPDLVKIGPFTTSQSGFPVFTWPVAYEVFVFDREVYLVINYSVDTYQWLAFGKSSVAGLPGTGAWFAGTSHGTSTSHSSGISISANGGGGSGAFFCPGIFWAGTSGNENYYVHSDLDGGGWSAAISGSSRVGVSALAPLVELLPNSWNSEAVLLPVRAYKYRASSKISLTADLAHCRITRNDNLEPSEIITLGSDRWKIFPCFRKNAADRNASRVASGTFAMAIRYEGP